ncbi:MULTISPECIES: hypothetical protein [Streptomycetaceae]|uniref:hypothetical protein n=1 Tax=Streptomycetaceae TaxID=2062 RepID=UPI00093B911D|nr:hypothetical protein [Streptomyces sp. CB02056]OKI00520.1 hypothetical protein AMK13_33085 [Streptomyces sp. CB02056]
MEENGRYDTVRNVGMGRYPAVDGDDAVLSDNPADRDVALENQGRFKTAVVGDGRALSLTGGKDSAPVEPTGSTGVKPSSGTSRAATTTETRPGAAFGGAWTLARTVAGEAARLTAVRRRA